MTCFGTDGFPEVTLRCFDMVSDGFRGFQRGFRGSETPDSYMRSDVCVIRFALGLRNVILHGSYNLFGGS